MAKNTAKPSTSEIPTPVVKASTVKASTAKAARKIRAPKPVAKRSKAPVAKPLAKPLGKPLAKALVKAPIEKPAKVKKLKPVRDSFTIPKAEYTVLDELKQRAGKLEHPVKKSELLRAGIKALAAMTDAAFLSALKDVPAIKTGRPKSN